MATRVSEEDAGAPTKRPILCAVLDLAGLGGAEPEPLDAPNRASGDPESTESARLSSAVQSALRKRACDFFEAGVDWIQLRDRRLDSATLYCVARIVSEQAAKAPNRRLLVNRRVDVAAATGSGAHLGFDAITRKDARRLLGKDRFLGVSCHSVAEVEAALEAICTASAPQTTFDYAHLAPIWNPISKPATRPALGLDALRSAAATGLAILAQGGLDPDRAREAVEAGAAGIAVTGQITGEANPIAAARALRAALDAARD